MTAGLRQAAADYLKVRRSACRRRHVSDRALARTRAGRDNAASTHADLTLKEKALARTTPLHAKPGRYQPPDKLLAFLEAL
jgi:hypothetical protein